MGVPTIQPSCAKKTAKIAYRVSIPGLYLKTGCYPRYACKILYEVILPFVMSGSEAEPDLRLEVKKRPRVYAVFWTNSFLLCHLEVFDMNLA